jgi:hypothetical protein
LATKQINFPDVVDKTEAEINQIMILIQESTLSDDIKTFIIRCIELSMWLPNFVLNTKISMHRFAVMIFGKGYKNANKPSDTKPSNNKSSDQTKTDQTPLTPDPANNKQATIQEPQPTNTQPHGNSLSTKDITEDNKKPGHGRMPYTVYKNIIEVTLNPTLKIGDHCPHNCGGKLHKYNAGHLIRIIGRPTADVYHYIVKKLRCSLCLAVVSAEIPPEIGKDKYDAYFKSQVVLSKYYLGMPFYRQENFQRMLDFPLSDATQWDLTEQVAGCGIPVFNILKQQAGNGKVIQNDDTWIRILSVIKQIKNGTAGKRTGMYTTNILSYYNGNKIALFLNGRKHSGENMADILQLRDPQADLAIQMCDALSANIPNKMQTILCNCLSHGVRKFKELVEFFPLECILILQMLGQIFEYDQQTKNLDPQMRLEYHQQHSQPIMEQLHVHMTKLLTEHKVEPNSELGMALKYMLRHWPKLTRFLTVAGAPIDNNLVEQALKIAIRNRKAAMFYRTEYSAYIGGVLTSLIYTCHLAKENPQNYLTALQNQKIAVAAKPELFLPWNYQDTIANFEAVAKQEGSSRQRDGPVAT